MKAIIHHNFEDYFTIHADTLEELKEIAFAECDKRGWKHENCWSEVEKFDERRNYKRLEVHY